MNTIAKSPAGREKKDSILIARISGRLKQEIARRAKSEGENITAYLERLVKNDLEAGHKINLDS